MDSATLDAAPRLTEPMLRRLDTPGPRYTSYPTADRFHTGFGAAEYAQALAAVRAGGDKPLSVYVHIPFCESLCYYCACNKVVTRHHDRAARYLDNLIREIELHRAQLGGRRAMSQLHFGGGTPTFMSDAELGRLVAALDEAFERTADIEASIEVDPRTVTAARLATLKRLGFNRISFGVQDFDPQVQKAVHRIQPESQVRDLMRAARELGFVSINVDLIYGLPKQSGASFARTVERVLELRPDRIALYAYAHLPQRFKPQRRIHEADLPVPQERITMLATAIDRFTAQGYDYIGMDHFALHDDALAVAKRERRLHRNFQGYTTRPDCDLLGLGVSAIAKVGTTFGQNAKTIEEYYDAIEAGRFATQRGYALDADDLLRRDVILALMCQGRCEFAPIERRHGIEFAKTFAAELADLRPLAEMGWVTVEPAAVQVTPLGWYFVRSVSSVFDAHLRRAQSRQGYSRMV
ncbi:MAG: oxygen-independent coproporphyrinogen III oxidase [Burkholderiaceae bacterium]